MFENKLEVGGSSPSPATKFTKFQIRWNEKLGRPECPYLTRWVLTFLGYSIRLHRWTGSDDQRFFHDHAWDFIVIMIRGNYIEITPDAMIKRKALSVVSYKAEHKHKVLFTGRPCWTIVLSKPKRKHWGMFVNGHRMRPLRYFSRYGLHQCD